MLSLKQHTMVRLINIKNFTNYCCPVVSALVLSRWRDIGEEDSDFLSFNSHYLFPLLPLFHQLYLNVKSTDQQCEPDLGTSRNAESQAPPTSTRLEFVLKNSSKVTHTQST